MRVMLVEDELATALGLTLMLKAQGAIVEHAEFGEKALEFLRLYDYEIVILDLMLPDIDGFEVLRRLRAAGNYTPVLIFSDLIGPADRAKGLGLGAADFVTKPFDRVKLLAHVQNIVRRCKGFSHAPLFVGPLQLRMDRREVTIEGRAVHLTRKEYSILELLVRRKGTVLSREALFDHLYGGMSEPVMKSIDVFVSALRKKLTQASADSMISTIWGRGYMIGKPAAARSPWGKHLIAITAARGRKMGAALTLTPDQQRDAIERRDQGETLQEIARTYNVHNTTILKLVRRTQGMTPGSCRGHAIKRSR